MNIQTAAYLDLQYFHRRSAKCPAEHLSLLLEWFTPFFYHHNSFCTVFWVSCFYLSANIVVLYQFTVTCIENFASKVEGWGLSDGKKVQDCDYVFRLSIMFQRRKEWICESRCRQVSVRVHVFAGFFALKPFHDYSLCSVCILPQPAVYF